MTLRDRLLAVLHDYAETGFEDKSLDQLEQLVKEEAEKAYFEGYNQASLEAQKVIAQMKP